MVEAKTQLLWSETKTTTKLGKNRGIPKTQLGFSLNQYLKPSWVLASTNNNKIFIIRK
jgi:hypothetical protein